MVPTSCGACGGKGTRDERLARERADNILFLNNILTGGLCLVLVPGHSLVGFYESKGGAPISPTMAKLELPSRRRPRALASTSPTAPRWAPSPRAAAASTSPPSPPTDSLEILLGGAAGGHEICGWPSGFLIWAHEGRPAGNLAARGSRMVLRCRRGNIKVMALAQFTVRWMLSN